MGMTKYTWPWCLMLLRGIVLTSGASMPILPRLSQKVEPKKKTCAEAVSLKK
jgi:hypothetical protein